MYRQLRSSPSQLRTVASPLPSSSCTSTPWCFVCLWTKRERKGGRERVCERKSVCGCGRDKCKNICVYVCGVRVCVLCTQMHLCVWAGRKEGWVTHTTHGQTAVSRTHTWFTQRIQQKEWQSATHQESKGWQLPVKMAESAIEVREDALDLRELRQHVALRRVGGLSHALRRELPQRWCWCSRSWCDRRRRGGHREEKQRQQQRCAHKTPRGHGRRRDPIINFRGRGEILCENLNKKKKKTGLGLVPGYTTLSVKVRANT